MIASSDDSTIAAKRKRTSSARLLCRYVAKTPDPPHVSLVHALNSGAAFKYSSVREFKYIEAFWRRRSVDFFDPLHEIGLGP